MWRGFNVDTRRRIRNVWRKKAPILARDPGRWNQATGPLSATICSVLEAGWTRAHQVSGKRQTLVLLWTALCSTRRRSSTVSPGIWKCKHGKERLGIRSVRVWSQEGQVSADQRGNIHGCTCVGLSCLWSRQQTSLDCRWIYSQPNVRCDQRALATRKHEF